MRAEERKGARVKGTYGEGHPGGATKKDRRRQ